MMYLKTLKEYKIYFNSILNKFMAGGLKYKPEKCAFHKTEIDFLKFLIGNEGVKIDPKRLT